MRGARGLRRALAAVLAVGLTSAAAQAEDLQRYAIFVETRSLAKDGFPPNGLWVKTRWLGEEKTVALRDDGVAPDAVAGDGTWSAAMEGPPVRFLRILVWGELGRGRRPVSSETVERVLGPEDALHLSGHFIAGLPRLRRLAGPGDLPDRQQAERRHLRWALGWALCNGVIAAVLVRRARHGKLAPVRR
ncbi:MAG: hypothetical protein JNM72_13130 [Deltaproteobacteria bacterium]|nr:hypothetical protein [Deltaproteobacteria bacterium]